MKPYIIVYAMHVVDNANCIDLLDPKPRHKKVKTLITQGCDPASTLPC